MVVSSSQFSAKAYDVPGPIDLIVQALVRARLDKDKKRVMIAVADFDS